MGRSSLLFITLTVYLSSLGSLIQTSHLPDNSVRMTRSTARNNNAPDSVATEVIFHPESSSDTVESSGQSVDSTASQKVINQTVIPKRPERAGTENRPGSGITLTTTPALTLQHSGGHGQEADRANSSITGYTHSSVHSISEEALSHITTEEQLKETHISIVNEDFLDGLSSDVDSPKFPVQNNVLTSMTNQNQSEPGGPCVLGLRPCVVLPNFNGTSLLWEDMRRTLAFAWELHVFGSAGLFILMAVLAVVGMGGACTLPHPVCDALILANSLLILSGTLRGFLLLLDPYGTRQILSRAALAAFHNVPLQLLLWAQVALTLVTLKGLNLLFFPIKLQQPWVVGGLAISHCTPLLVADLFSQTLSPTLPLLLQTLSLCWGLPFCLGMVSKSFSHTHPFLRSSVPQWVPSPRVETRAKRVTAVCAFLGVLCFSFQMYSLLWLYGLLGNWRRFGWGWWLSQFWARILELAWGFSLLVLGSWIFWLPSRGHSRGDNGQGRSEVSKGLEETSLWGNILASIQKGPLRKSEKTWEDLMPSTWAKYNLSKAGFSNNIMCPYDDQPCTIIQEYKPNPAGISSSESQAALLWQKVGERECVLSLIEFDMRPPSPINLRRSIDNALHHGQLVAGGLFTPPPPSWIHSVATDATDGECGTTTFPPAYVGYGWKLDTESISASLDHFQAKEQIQSADADYNGSAGSPATAHQEEEFNSAFSAVMHHDWCEDDITDL
ncbi:proline-rich transmembrane protein 3-like [Dicentrarchus labrax]|uniref:Si:ch211-14i3.2 n=1 Tax=Dicentrarchus labrax TaxID=13489 RepID=A0A8C4GPQ0_DICLA|nr:proline-rich transmembrane protein 3-like [Dicentrarchus labrax]XP_051272331.1 proline-rich transmembrane protein 3-like [Dicentrarchus labrax]XP_051272332.1 proline-rich transmembrane protein 3-like [Dicentrarchus labrax]XP_051272333.1 proline-rich transmembrane protein 3-like [Dicentrarchus labrax]XP_051272334.1 proline-rich transmembrane protein 3-like [Dicentrarchus labrax]XP_051272335.1 proline-rich transmembrane protein 3-like [Dicentrarchus labrax]XP_051272336.1 proline-rich transme